MRPLIEILEDERALMQKLESVHRFILKDDDPEVFDILMAQQDRIERNLDQVHVELRDYIAELFKGGDGR